MDNTSTPKTIKKKIKFNSKKYEVIFELFDDLISNGEVTKLWAKIYIYVYVSTLVIFKYISVKN